MPQIDLHAVVPVVDGDAFSRVAVVVAGIVDQNPDRAVPCSGLGHSQAQRLDVAQIAMNEARCVKPGASQAFDQRQ